MDYSVLADVYEKLESTPAKLVKRDILAELLLKTPSELLPKITLLVCGRVFPQWSQQEIGVANKMMIRAIAKATGFKKKGIIEKFKKTGDLGLSAEECVKKRKQVALLRKKLNVNKVFENIQKLSTITGIGSQGRKLNLIAELLVFAKPKEARYIVRTVLEELRIGVAEGIVRDAIAKAFNVDASLVENAWNLLPDYGEIAKVAKEKRNKGLKRVKLEIGKPIKVMLGEKADSIKEVIEEFGKVAAEYKYDGMRAMIQKKDNNIWIYTRRLEDVTKQFPDIVNLCKKGLKSKECIVEGEVLGINPKNGMPLPFQVLSQRIHRKYDIGKMASEIPIQVYLFDIVYLDGKMLFDKPFKERRKILERIVKVIPKKFALAKQLITDDLKKADKFYKEALRARQEGLILKVLDSPYVFGRHVGTMYKIKPIMETLDLAIIGAEWGTGKRARWLSSYVLACRDPDTGKFLPCGMMGTGLTEDQFKMMTDKLKELVVEEKGRLVKIKPKIVVEVAYQEIQKSPNYDSGYALRFPRLIRLREEKGAEETDTIERVLELFKTQGRVG